MAAARLFIPQMWLFGVALGCAVMAAAATVLRHREYTRAIAPVVVWVLAAGDGIFCGLSPRSVPRSGWQVPPYNPCTYTMKRRIGMTLAKWMAAGAISLLCAVSVAAHAKGGGAGGGSAAHISTQGTVNSNGPASADRDKGGARAADRAHRHGKSSSHRQAGKLK
ncbi:hypothetical protein [Ralstonia solanacearum]|nr:hypothetical protein [Ralstonia solanacearum]